MENEKAKKIDWIKGKLTKSIKTFKYKTNYNRNKTIFFHLFTVLLGGIIALLGGLGTLNWVGLNKFFDIVILVLGIIITSMATYYSIFNNKNKWVLFQKAQNRLKKIEDKFLFYLQGKEIKNVEIEYLEKIQGKIQKVLDNTNNKWASLK